jgi:hypothetical protein
MNWVNRGGFPPLQPMKALDEEEVYVGVGRIHLQIKHRIRLSPLCRQIWMIRVPRRKGRHTLLGSAWILRVIGITPIQTNHLWALLTFDRTLALHIWKAVKQSKSWFTSHLHMEIYYPPSTFPAFWSRVPQLLNNISSTNSPQQKHEQQLKNDLHRILHITTKKLNRFSHTEIVGTILLHG